MYIHVWQSTHTVKWQFYYYLASHQGSYVYSDTKTLKVHIKTKVGIIISPVSSNNAKVMVHKYFLALPQ